MSDVNHTPTERGTDRDARAHSTAEVLTDVKALRHNVLQRAMPSRKQRFPGIAFGVLADLSAVGLLALSMWLIVRAGEQPPILHLTFAIVGVRALAIGRAAFRYVERIASHSSALAQLATLRTETFASLVPRVPGAIESQRRGEVLSTLVDDVDQLQDEPLRVRQPIVVSAIVIGLSVVAIALASPLAALILATALALSGTLAAFISARTAGRSDRELSQARANLTDRLLERFSAAETLTAFGALGMQRQRIVAAEKHLDNVQLQRARAAGMTGGILSLAAGLATLLIFITVQSALGVDMSAALFAAVVVVPFAVFEIYGQVLQGLVARRTVQSSADRIVALTEGPLPAEIPVDPVTAASLSAATVSDEERNDASVPPLISVAHLAARHPGAAQAALSDVSFDLRAGETLVITGESGAGKSTLALALVRLLEYQGSYRLRGVEARTLSGQQVREHVGLCEQSPHLFDADLRQNLKFAREGADDNELLAVLSRVGLGEWVEERGGLDASVGERGSLVSGGQAQRIALARALLADFPVVVLDEPTAGVDRELADQLVTDLLGAVPEGRAVILITHTDVPEGVTSQQLQLSSPA